MGRISNIWEQQQIKITFMMKLRAD